VTAKNVVKHNVEPFIVYFELTVSLHWHTIGFKQFVHFKCGRDISYPHAIALGLLIS